MQEDGSESEKVLREILSQNLNTDTSQDLCNHYSVREDPSSFN